MTTKDYSFPALTLRYVTHEDGHVFLWLLPRGYENRVKAPWSVPAMRADTRADYNPQFRMGALVHLMLDHHPEPGPYSGKTLKFGQAVADLRMKGQTTEEVGEETHIVTVLESPEGYRVRHTAAVHRRYGFCRTFAVFENTSDRSFTLSLITSFSLDVLSPFGDDDQSETIRLHRFHGGWSREGVAETATAEALGLEKSWQDCFPSSVRYGSLGGFPCEIYFPLSVAEDRKNGVSFAATIAHNASWQMELTRAGDAFSFSGGLADRDFGHWQKTVLPGDSFCTPDAYITAVAGDRDLAASVLCRALEPARRAYGEKGILLPVYNEFCATWSDPTETGFLRYAEALKRELDFSGYMVIDAGWSEKSRGQGGNGDWIPDGKRFPHMKEMNRKLRDMGIIPGIWFEFEVSTSGADLYLPAYDAMHLKRNGRVLSCGGWRTFLDFRRDDVRKYLEERVIAFLKEYGFGYIKVDYNGNPGLAVDGPESPGENLRVHYAAVVAFFRELKREIPDIVIENCASGGNRIEPLMMSVSALSSVSDAHEALEIPVIAANMQRLMLPSQALIWAVVRGDDSEERLVYTMAASFLGRPCLSGDVTRLSSAQWQVLRKAMAFYRGIAPLLSEPLATIRFFGGYGRSVRHPSGTQAVVRKDGRRMLVVAHAFDDPGGALHIPLEDGFAVKADFYAAGRFGIAENDLVIPPMLPRTALALYLEKI